MKTTTRLRTATLAVLLLFSFKASAQESIASFVMDTNQICQGGSVNFTNTSTGQIVSQTWTFNGAQIFNWFESGNPPAILYPNWNAGGFWVTLQTVDVNGWYSTYQDHVTVWPSPVVETVFSPQSTVCAGDSMLFTVETNALNPSFEWRSYDGTFDTIVPTNSIVLSEEGGYHVRAIDERGCKSSNWGVSVNVHYPISLNLSVDFSNPNNLDTVEICERDYPVYLSANVGGVYNYSNSMFTWQNGEQGPSCEIDSSGMYHVVVDEDMNVCGAVSDSLFIVVHPKPIPGITITPSGAEFCEGDIVTLSTDTGYSNIVWIYTTFSTQFSAQTDVFNPEQSGTYRAVVTDEFGCTGFSETPFIAIHPRPNKPEVIVADGCALAASTAPTGTTYTYQWFLQNDSIVGETEQYLNASTAGFYTVQTMYVENGCANISDPVYASCDPSGIDAVAEVSSVAYPNPFTERFVLSNDRNVSISATLFDMFGKVVSTNSGNSSIVFDDLSVAPGVYQLVVDDGTHQVCMRMVKQ